jgi:hypothetical protein
VRFDEEPRKDIFEECLARFTTADKMDVEFDMTPTAGMSWIYEDIYQEEKTKSGDAIEWFKLCSVNNPKANLSSLDEIYANLHDYEARKMRLLGEFVSLSGLVYGRYFKRRKHVVRPEDLGLEPWQYLRCRCSGTSLAAPDRRHVEGCPWLEYVTYLGVDPHEVKPSTALVLCMDRHGRHFVDACYKGEKTMPEVARDIKGMMEGYRYIVGRCDPHADSSKTAFDNRNIWKMLTRGPDAVPRLRKADAYSGSRLAGVDVIRQLLSDHPITKKPRLYIIDRPENEELISSFRTLERQVWANEEVKGQRDEIKEGKHDHHACLRYILQSKTRWAPHETKTLELVLADVEAGY